MREAMKYINNPFHHTLSTQNVFFLQHINFDSLLGKTVLYTIPISKGLLITFVVGIGKLH